MNSFPLPTKEWLRTYKKHRREAFRGRQLRTFVEYRNARMRHFLEALKAFTGREFEGTLSSPGNSMILQSGGARIGVFFDNFLRGPLIGVQVGILDPGAREFRDGDTFLESSGPLRLDLIQESLLKYGS